MRKLLLISFILTTSLYASAQCVTNVDFNTWTQAGRPANGNWVVQGGGSEVRQTINGSPTFYISPFDLMNVSITGRFKSTDTDDDWMGFVFSFLDPMGATDDFDCWLFDWKQDWQGASPRGMSLNRAEGVIPPNLYGTHFKAHQNGPPFTVMQADFGGPGWDRNENYDFELRLTYTRATIYIDGVLIFDQTGCFKPGRFGFYNYSQEDCYYSNFQYDLFIDFFVDDDGKACLGDVVDFEFVNPCLNFADLSQYQSMEWDFGDGSPTVVNNNPTFSNANVSHVYPSAGTYTATLTVTDNNNCSKTATRIIEIADPIVLNPTVTEPSCNGAQNGEISLNPTGGFGNYLYYWNGGVNNQQTWVGRSAGTYTVVVTDSICSTSGQFTLDQPTPLTASVTSTDATCNANDGTASISISGGTPPYQNISWAGIPGATRTGLYPGTYIADFEDANGCSAVLQYTATINSLPCGITASTSTSDVSCLNGNDGSATLTVTGSTPPVNISWSNGDTGPTAVNLTAGTYTYTYTDNDPNHDFNGTVTIQEPTDSLELDLQTIGISCPGANDGQAIASVISGGNPPYNYNWSGGQANDPVASNLAPGTISVTVTDILGCGNIASATISSVPTLSSSITTVIDSCYRAGKGSATVAATGGTPPYNYEWSDFSTNRINDNLRADTYYVTITDDNGCSIIDTAIVGGPSDPLSYTYIKEDVECAGDSTGSFDINVTGGTPGYIFDWDSSFVSGNNPTGLPAGIYNYSITDLYGCVVYGGDTIFEPDTALTVLASTTDVTCHGADDGTLTLVISGGTPPYSYQGNPLPVDSVTLTNLPPGNYTGSVEDSNGCSFTVNETITEPGPQSLTIGSIDNLCYGESEGLAFAEFINATGAVNYSWTGGLNGDTITNLTAGTYTVTATDQNNCTLIDSVEITEPTELTYSSNTTDVDCYGNNTGSINITASGGTSGYTYQWDSASVSGNNPTGLYAGIYSYTITDANNCEVLGSDTLNQPDAPLTLTVSATDVNCNGANDGTLTIVVSGGTPSYSYQGNPLPVDSVTLTNLPPGNYSGDVEDASGCIASVNETITEPGPQSLDLNGTDNPCFGASLGSADANFVNATGTVSYGWTGGLSGSSISNLSAGTYTVTATDQNNCALIDSIIISEPTPDTLTVNVTDASCFGEDGSATANPVGGNPPYTFTWSDGSSGQTVDLPAGNYTVTALEDATGCGEFGTFSIDEPDELIIAAQLTDIDCNGDDSGNISITASGGSGGGYSYDWTPNISNSNIASSLTAGDYTVNITDSDNCQRDSTFTINEPTPIGLSASATDLLCFEDASGSIDAGVTGGNAPHDYVLWENGTNLQNSSDGNFSGLSASTYTIVVTDASACIDSATVQVNEPALLQSQSSAQDISCFGFGDGRLNASASGGTPDFTYELLGEQNNNGIFDGLQAGSYTLNITDANGCTTSESFVIEEPDSLNLFVNPDSAIVDAGEILELLASTNLNGAFNYTWEPENNLSCYDCADPEFTAIFSTSYTVTAIDTNGCLAEHTVILEVIPNHNFDAPDAFTPNGDGVNDTWNVYGNIEGLKEFRVLLFDRWGELVFESRDPNFQWDGTRNGTPLSPDVFVWRVSLVFYDGYTERRSGSVTLIK
ncbi:MAG: T9SS type B sorting domain-containing protein [Chitinophagales bacterium]